MKPRHFAVVLTLYVLCFVAIALAGCATAPAPSVVVGHIDAPPAVNVPVLVRCIDPAQIPSVPPSSMPARSSGIAELANGAAADAVKYRDLAQRQNEMLKACATKAEP